jgi:hypothetical protein
LISTLNPIVSDTFGPETCSEYVEATMGSIQDMTALMVAGPTAFVLPAPGGDLTFDNAVPVVAEWTISHTGEQQSVTFHLVEDNGAFTWLTTCSVTTNRS